MLACETNKYARLYARWMAKPGELLDFAGMTKNDKILDLCGGTGAVALEALDRGAREVHLLDLNPRIDHPQVRTVKGRAEEAPDLLGERFSLVVCRQALGYLEPVALAEAVHGVLRPGGRFVFNNFVRPKWGIKSYKFEGERYLEAFGYLGAHVVHLQANLAIGVDVTHFRWHKHQDVVDAFFPWFHIRFAETEKTVRYFCTRKEATSAVL